MNFDDYKKSKGINASFLKAALNGLQSAYNYLHSPVKETPAMVFGSAVHAYIESPEAFRSVYAVSPKFDRRTKEGKAASLDFEASSQGKKIIDEEQFDTILAIYDNCMNHPLVSEIIANYEKEKSFFWNMDGIDFKARLDLVDIAQNVVVDIKTTSTTSTRDFLNDCLHMAYDVQFLTYAYALQAKDFPDVYAIAVESNTAEIALYNLTPIVNSDYTRARFKRALEVALKAQGLTEKPAKYSSDVITLELPSWTRIE